MNNDGSDMGAKCEQLYLMSKKRLEEDDDPDMCDEVVVLLWRTVEDLTQKHKALQNVCNEQALELAHYCYKQDILESRIALLSGEKSLNGIEET